ncbi:SprT family zinc-dependent metalloprotease [Caulobacter sp. 17J65-9]|uniref:YgjP-like metallopeptidase domain-containing protein n=1 Tax=Caulobacter sp. 17J65-9 TaxID=2709382 RepID=UPI0013C84E01|nr:M48 family metallopeptidase [Caulobacter sp. 17J65-9]
MSLLKPKLAHGDVVEIEGVPVRLKVHARARRVSLRVDARGEVVAIAPNPRRLHDALAFARERVDWITSRAAAAPCGVAFAPGSTVPVRGETARLTAIAGASAARLLRDEAGLNIVSGGEGAAFARRVDRLLKTEARRDLEHRTELHVRALGLDLPKVALGDPKSRWGSCTPARGSIRYSWRLILAPAFVLDYVAAHEVAHLVHADHSPRFWGVVRDLLGDEKAGRNWLKAHGRTLHAYGR